MVPSIGTWTQLCYDTLMWNGFSSLFTEYWVVWVCHVFVWAGRKSVIMRATVAIYVPSVVYNSIIYNQVSSETMYNIVQ